MTNKTHKVIEEGVAEFKEQFSAYQTTSNQPYPLLVDWFKEYSQKLVEVTRESERQKIVKIIESAKLEMGPHELNIHPTAWCRVAGSLVSHTKSQLIKTLTKDTPAED